MEKKWRALQTQVASIGCSYPIARFIRRESYLPARFAFNLPGFQVITLIPKSSYIHFSPRRSRESDYQLNFVWIIWIGCQQVCLKAQLQQTIKVNCLIIC